MSGIDFGIYPDISQDLLEETFKKDNFLIEYSDKESNLAVIYFSSHAVFYPNEKEAFEKHIVQRNRFENYGHRISKAKKHIFVRDIMKQFYVHGINTEIDCIDKLMDFLSQETKGMDVITVGFSAGGYMSILAGTLLNAKLIFAFSPFVNLFDLFDGEESFKYYSQLYNNRNNEKYSKYYNLLELIKESNSPIMYLYPTRSVSDVKRLEYLPSNLKNIYKFGIISDQHGDSIHKKALLGYLNSSADELIFINKLLKAEHSKIVLNIIFYAKYLLNKVKKPF